MPYRIEKQGNQFVLINKETGKVKSHHATKKKAAISAWHATSGDKKRK